MATHDSERYMRFLPSIDKPAPIPAYILSPYSGTDEDRKRRFEAVARFCAWLHTNPLNGRNYIPFSPIVHNHPMAELIDLPTDIEYWWPQNVGMLDKLRFAIIFCISGFRESKGMAREFQYIHDHRIPYLPVYRAAIGDDMPYIVPDTAHWQRLPLRSDEMEGVE